MRADIKEGGYTVDEFIVKWKEINGSWDPDEYVWVYQLQIHKELKL